jgi:hypothetical protein
MKEWREKKNKGGLQTVTVYMHSSFPCQQYPYQWRSWVKKSEGAPIYFPPSLTIKKGGGDKNLGGMKEKAAIYTSFFTLYTLLVFLFLMPTSTFMYSSDSACVHLFIALLYTLHKFQGSNHTCIPFEKCWCLGWLLPHSLSLSRTQYFAILKIAMRGTGSPNKKKVCFRWHKIFR